MHASYAKQLALVFLSPGVRLDCVLPTCERGGEKEFRKKVVCDMKRTHIRKLCVAIGVEFQFVVRSGPSRFDFTPIPMVDTAD